MPHLDSFHAIVQASEHLFEQLPEFFRHLLDQFRSSVKLSRSILKEFDAPDAIVLRRDEALIEAVQQAHQQFLAAVNAVPETLIRATPRAGEWSTLDVLLHMRTIAAFELSSFSSVFVRGERPPDGRDALTPAPPEMTRTSLLADLEYLRTQFKALIPDAQACPNLPIYLAALGPKNLELTGELADGWLGTAFLPEHARMFFDPIEAGAKRAGRSLADLEIQVSAGVVSFSDDLERLILPRKPGLAFTLGAMGSRKQNFYNEVFQRAGYAELALQVQDLWLNHQREAATALIPDDLVLKTNLLGTKERVRERLRIYRDGGVKTIDVAPDGQTIEERLAVLGQLIELVNEINAETVSSPGSNVS